MASDGTGGRFGHQNINLSPPATGARANCDAVGAAPLSKRAGAAGWTAPQMMGDIRFIGLCAKLDLCRYWAQTGCWPDRADVARYDFKAESRRLAQAER